ncbi:hypothetical protein INT47_003621 [Mucor saturninus]|uniref:Uncharacterized protein n=1 Tax=Mucor saturninus TaxID=64648 RepID=A0A8H7QI77_9FUNG|nr:hypothetical protein INT47_003621 [Mucor saturninus]
MGYHYLKEKKDPIFMVATGSMNQQPTVSGFFGRAVEEKFHLSVIALRILPCTPFVAETLKDMVHPDIGPVQITKGVREGYFYVNLSLNHDFTNGPEFYASNTVYEELDDFELKILERNQRRSGNVHDDEDEIEENSTNINTKRRTNNQNFNEDDHENELFFPENYTYDNARRFSESTAASLQPTNLKEPIQKALTEVEIFVENVMTELNNEKGLLANHIQKIIGTLSNWILNLKKLLTTITVKILEQLCHPFVTIATDGVIGNGQTSTKFWDRIKAVYNAKIGDNAVVERGSAAITIRWNTINPSVQRSSQFVSTQDQLSWSTVASRGASKKVLRPLPVSAETDSLFKLKSNLLFQRPELDYQLMVRQAASIVKQALTPGSVLFSFPASLFKHRTEAYELIEAHCGAVQGFRPNSNYGTRSTGEIMVEVKFVMPTSTTKAMIHGVSYKNFLFKGSPSVPSGNNRLVHAKVKEYTCGGYFEGELSLILDISAGYIDAPGDNVMNEPLTNNLYLEEWDCFASATFKSAPTVCHWCRLAGHFCKRKKHGVTELPVWDEIPIDLLSPTVESLQAEVLSDSDTDISGVSTSPKFEPSGSAASKFATTAASSSMEVDNHVNTTTPSSSTAVPLSSTVTLDILYFHLFSKS